MHYRHMFSNKRLIPHPDSAITNLFEMSVLYINRTALTTTPNIFSLCKDQEGFNNKKQTKKKKKQQPSRHGIFSTQGDYFSTFVFFW